MMTSISRALLLSAALMAAPVVGAVAQQQGNPGGNYGSNRSSTATPGTADNSAASGMNTGSVGARNTTGNNLGMSSNAPGAPSAHQGAPETYNSQTTALPGPNTNTGGGGVGAGAGSSK